MEFRTKFNKGDKVFTLSQKNVRIFCPHCNGVGEIKFNGNTYYCKECNGKGTQGTTEKKWFVEDKVKCVCGIRIFSDKEHGTKIEYYENLGYVDIFFAEEKDCFATQKAAQKECDRRNNK